MVWPTVRYGWPDRLAVGLSIQPPLPGFADLLLGSATVGRGGAKVGVGIGKFGGSLMVGYAVQATLLRTNEHPRGAPRNQTFVGVEGEVMLGNLSIRAGPAVRVGGRDHSGRDVRVNISVGLGF
jgi:hypothetical protein